MSGARFEHSALVAVEPEAVARYAAAIGETRLGALAPPMFVAVYAAPAVWPLMLALAREGDPLLHFAQEFEWDAPVRAGDVIRTHAWLARSERGALGSFHTLASRSHNQDGEEVSRGSWTILIAGVAA